MLFVPLSKLIGICPRYLILPSASMAWESKRDHDAITTYNKMLKQPLKDQEYPVSELRQAKKYFEKIREYRRRSEVGFEPSKLFLVRRIAELSGRPHWEKQLMIDLNIIGPQTDYAIVKNTPSMNKKLWTIKHLIRITPITFPNGFPEDDGDYSGTFLKQTGELVISPHLKVDSELMVKDPETERKTLDPNTIRYDLRLKWDSGYPKMY